MKVNVTIEGCSLEEARAVFAALDSGEQPKVPAAPAEEKSAPAKEVASAASEKAEPVEEEPAKEVASAASEKAEPVEEEPPKKKRGRPKKKKDPEPPAEEADDDGEEEEEPPPKKARKVKKPEPEEEEDDDGEEDEEVEEKPAPKKGKFKITDEVVEAMNEEKRIRSALGVAVDHLDLETVDDLYAVCKQIVDKDPDMVPILARAANLKQTVERVGSAIGLD